MSPRRTEWIETPDWIETNIDKMLAKAKATGYLEMVLYYVESYTLRGYAWDVALAKVLAKC
jgi:hypothetical protein